MKRNLIRKMKNKETEVTNINDTGLFEETPSSSELEDFMFSSISGLNENSFLNSTLLLPNFSKNTSKETETNLSVTDILGTGQDLLSKNEECYQLRYSNERLKVGTYDWFNNSNEKILFHT